MVPTASQTYCAYQLSVHRRFLHKLRQARNERLSVFEVRVKRNIVDDRRWMSFDVWLLVGKWHLLQLLHVGDRSLQRDVVGRSHLPFVPTSTSKGNVLNVARANKTKKKMSATGFKQASSNLSQEAEVEIRRTNTSCPDYFSFTFCRGSAAGSGQDRYRCRGRSARARVGSPSVLRRHHSYPGTVAPRPRPAHARQIRFFRSYQEVANNRISLIEFHGAVLFTRKSSPENKNLGGERRCCVPPKKKKKVQNTPRRLVAHWGVYVLKEWSPRARAPVRHRRHQVVRGSAETGCMWCNSSFRRSTKCLKLGDKLKCTTLNSQGRQSTWDEYPCSCKIS